MTCPDCLTKDEEIDRLRTLLFRMNSERQLSVALHNKAIEETLMRIAKYELLLDALCDPSTRDLSDMRAMIAEHRSLLTS